MTPPRWRVGPTRTLTLDAPRVIAILNATPDSFSDGGELPTEQAIVARAHAALSEGADMLDIGGESTRPGAARVSAEDQIRRTAPGIRAIRDAGIDAPLSIDTTLAAVAEAALDAGADAINDVSGATEDAGMIALAARRGCGLVLMHRLAPPTADRYSNDYHTPPTYPGGVVTAVRTFLAEARARAIAAGVAPEAIVLDPGLGFGKSVEQNYELVRAARELEAIGSPTLSAASRKSFIGAIVGEEEPKRRLAGSVALSVAHALAGVRLFRVHDVRAHAQALRVAMAASRGAF